MMISTSLSSRYYQELPILDHSWLYDITGGDPSLVEELLTIYLDDVKERLQRAYKHIATQDRQALHREIHSIKGSSSSIGARQMHHLIQTIESYLLDGKLELFQQLLQSVPPTLQSLRQHVQQLRLRGYIL